MSRSVSMSHPSTTKQGRALLHNDLITASPASSAVPFRSQSESSAFRFRVALPTSRYPAPPPRWCKYLGLMFAADKTWHNFRCLLVARAARSALALARASRLCNQKAIWYVRLCVGCCSTTTGGWLNAWIECECGGKCVHHMLWALEKRACVCVCGRVWVHKYAVCAGV